MKFITVMKVSPNKASRLLCSINIYFLLLAIVWGCGSAVKQNDPDYVASIEHWQQLRIDSLKGKTGYLNLAGLFWLEEGENRIGSDSSNNFIFPAEAPGYLGSLVIAGDSIWLNNAHPELKVAEGLTGESILIQAPDLERRSMRFNDLQWYIIQRGDEYGIRLKDYSHPLITTFKGIENYPIDINWRVEARFETYAEPKIVEIKNQVGMTLKTPVYGQFHFELMGEKYTLEPVSELASESYFTMIFDQTSGDETYGSGRYIDVPRPDENGLAVIDFNKSYNPPCAWTEFATCTFPHAANRLPLRIEAGEKYSGNH